MECQQKIRWTLYSSFAVVLIFLSVTEVGHFSAMRKALFPTSNRDHQKYVIVFDGGSTGTRIHIFSFLNNTDGLLTLEDEYFQETKPGLSSFADSPRNAANSVLRLLEKAKSLVPSHRWDETPVTLKATAGLRLLPSHASNSILDEVSDLFKNSPFITDENCVSVLDGEDEGVYAWYTLNFLLDRLKEPSKSVASLDLGGGSTQVTFASTDLDTIVFSPRGYIINRRVQNKTTAIYSHSYLGLGLMSARLSILRLPDKDPGIDSDPKILRSPCIAPHTKVNWKQGTEEFSVMGPRSGVSGFQECYEKVVSFLNNTVDRPEELWKREIYALSYYFDRAFDMGIIDKKGGIVTVGEYMQATINACSTKQPSKPFLCLDATYITAFLQHGLGFSDKKELMLVKQIDGIETSWGLGAAFSMLR